MIIENNEASHRYIGHVEEDPMVWQDSSNNIDEIIRYTKSLIDHRIVNGAGAGVVVDTRTDRIVSCFGMPMPDDPSEEKRVVEVVKGWFSGEMCSIEPEDAYQHIATIPSYSCLSIALSSEPRA